MPLFFFTVEQQERAIVERFGKFVRVAGPGLQSKSPFVEKVAGRMSLQVEQLNAGRRQLASAPRRILSNTSTAARIIALLVLLATVSPWLLLLPVAAGPAAVQMTYWTPTPPSG